MKISKLNNLKFIDIMQHGDDELSIFSSTHIMAWAYVYNM